jgi:hypothetical protein
LLRCSDHILATLRDSYLAALNNPDILQITDENGIVRARLHEMLTRADETFSGPDVWGIWRDLKSASARKDRAGYSDAAARMDAAFSTIAADNALWVEIDRTLARLGQLVKLSRIAASQCAR